MPELPEVEVTRRGIIDPLLAHKISKVYFDDKSLRKPFSQDLKKLENAKVLKVERRAKYIIITTDKGYLLIHLGMTGHLKVNANPCQLSIHDHFAITTDSNVQIVLNDVRRFGLVEYFGEDNPPCESSLLKSLGVEPLSEDFTAEYLFKRLNRLKKSIKQALMDNSIVVGIGNIYASELLFDTSILPTRSSHSITLQECQAIVKSTVKILNESIKKGGTTIRDFEGADGKLGYFVQNLKVYGHYNEPCQTCGTKIEKIVQGQRTTYYCPHCQK